MGSLKALIHGLAAATTRLLTHSGRLPPTLLNLSIDLTTFGPEAFPASFDQLCKTVEEVDGVKFKDLFFQLAGPDADGDEMMKTVLQMAQENREG